MTFSDICNVRIGVVALACALFGTGCVMGPERGDKLLSSQQEIYFSGYATKPGGVVEIDAYNKATEKWQVIAKATATTIPVTLDTDKLYYWTKPLKLAGLRDPAGKLVDWACFIDNDCYVVDLERDIKFRFHQDAAPSTLFTFGQGGALCAHKQADQGASAYEAYERCKPVATDEYPLDVLYMIKPYDIGNEDF
jgi:hypothetical protein